VSTRLSVDVDVDAAAGMLDELAAKLENPRPLLEVLADEIRDYERQVFATRGFGRWPALDLETARRKRGGRVLVDTGDMLASLTRYPARDAVQDFGADSVTVATTDVAAIMHQHGRHSPKRNPAPAPSSTQVRQWADTALRALLEGR
jgi:phage gpG-like protein